MEIAVLVGAKAVIGYTAPFTIFWISPYVTFPAAKLSCRSGHRSSPPHNPTPQPHRRPPSHLSSLSSFISQAGRAGTDDG